jgi:GNAT superfamily N-acetyltransferase
MRANEFTNFTYKTEPYEGWNGDGIVVRAYDGSTEVGHVIFEPTEDDNTQWYAVDVEVEEPYQRKGIASKMYDIAKKAATQQGAIIVKSHAQTDAGRGLWQDKLVWEAEANKTTLNNMYGGHFPDRDEEFWDYVTPRELGQALTVETMQKHKVLIILLSQYRAEHIDDITDMLDDDQQEIVQSYVNDPALSSKTIVVANNKIIDGNHRALAAAIKGVPINYVDLAELDEEPIDEAEIGTINAKTIANQLKAAGYSNVGTGADSTVWAKDENYIIKILMPEDLGTKAEQVFRKFYEFAMSHQDLACMPRFNEVNTVDINGKDYTQIEMERLAPIEKGTFMEGVIWFFSDFCQAQESWDKVDHAMGLSDTWEWYPYAKSSKSIANIYIRQWQDLMYDKKSYSMYRQLYNVMKLLYNTGTINKFGWDLHTANVMQRSNGQPVIIDPWFSEGTS